MLNQMDRVVQKLANQKSRVLLLLGEAGAGKSEIAVNLALQLAATGQAVRFFDMDQTKPLFRSRTVAATLRQANVWVDEAEQFLDAPVIPAAVSERIHDSRFFTIIDIGGNATGARCIGQFAKAWPETVAAYLVMNPFRPFSDCKRNIERTVEEIIAATRLEKFAVFSNPNFGERTRLQDVLDGQRRLATLLSEIPYCIEFLAAPDLLAQQVQHEFPELPVLGVVRHITAPW